MTTAGRPFLKENKNRLRLRRGTRVRKPNYRLTDYDLAVRPKDQIKDASLNSADEGLIDENSGNSTEDSSSDDDR